ncbi:hypothetical protein DE146DRAFT_735692 [Phaeosphaeria sp. MPI-PUGE-AT-0046c]|nr:hypothetical protein DE146DRAFT_735692 [Phaeosphaeria sp. MPI-PUGE-AT-0046c]
MSSNSLNHPDPGHEDNPTTSYPFPSSCSRNDSAARDADFESFPIQDAGHSPSQFTGGWIESRTSANQSMATEGNLDVYHTISEQHSRDPYESNFDAHFNAEEGLDPLLGTSSYDLYDPFALVPNSMSTADMYDSQLFHTAYDFGTNSFEDPPRPPIAPSENYIAQNSDFQAGLEHGNSMTQYMTEASNYSHNYATETSTTTETVQNSTSEFIFNDISQASTDTGAPDFADWRTTNANLPYAEHTNAIAPDQSTYMVPDSVMRDVEFSPEINIRKRGPISNVDYSLPKKRQGGRRGALTMTQLESFRKAKKQGVCIRCRFVRLKCQGGFPCTACVKGGTPKLWITPCTKAEFFDIIMAATYFPYASLYEATKVQTLDLPSSIGHVALMTYLCRRDGTIVVSNNKMFYPFESKLALPWILGLGSLLEILSTQDHTHLNPASIGQVREGLVRFAKTRRNRNGLIFGNSEDAEEALRSLIFCIYGPYSWDVRTVEHFPHDSSHTLKIITETVELLIFLTVRHMELCLFRHLQDVSNDLPKDDVEKHHTYIMFLLLILTAGKPMNRTIADSFEIGADNDMMTSIMISHSDTVKRIRTALWIYASVAISKLSAWTNFWETAVRMNPLMTKEVILESFAGSEDGFLESIGKAEKPIIDSMERLHNMEQTLNGLGCGGCEENDTLSRDELRESVREFFNPGALEKLVVEHDKYTTGGLFTAETEDNQVHAAARRFQILCSVEWLSCFPGTDSNLFLCGEISSVFMDIVRSRLKSLHQFRSFQRLIDDENKTNPENSMTLDELIRQLPDLCQTPVEEDEEDSAEIIRECTDSVLRGKRWNDIAELLGADEAVLIGGVYDMPSTNAPDARLNIIAIVEFGTAEEFERLENLLRNELQWLKSICSQLHGILPMIMELASLPEADETRALALAEQIKGKCLEVFGGNTSSEATRALKAVDFGVSGVIMTTIICAITISQTTVPTATEREDERDLFYGVLEKSFRELWVEHYEGKNDLTLACTERMLRQAKRTFFSSCDERMHQHERNSMEAEQAMFRRVRLSQAIDALLALVLFAHTKYERKKRSSDIEYEADKRQLKQEIENCAELFAFAME